MQGVLRTALLATFFLFSSSTSIPAIQRSEVCPVLLEPHQPLLNEDEVKDKLLNRRQKRPPRIVGGDVTGKDLRRYMAQVISFDFVGSGVLVAPRVVFTAAHCDVFSGDTVILGGSKIYDGTEIRVKRVVTPSQYDSYEYYYDFRISILSSDAPKESAYMLVNTNDSILLEDSAVRVVGYGRTDENRYFNHTGWLRQVDVLVVPFKVCRSAYESEFNIKNDLQVCAGYSRGKCDSCQGDSGGPLLQYDRTGRPVIVGVTSFGYGCARPHFPGVYTRMSIFRNLLSGIENVDFTNEVESVFSSASPSPSSLLPTSPGESMPSSGAAIAASIVVLFFIVAVISIALLIKCSRRT